MLDALVSCVGLQAACDETSEKSERAFVQLLLTSSSGNSNNEVFSLSLNSKHESTYSGHSMTIS